MSSRPVATLNALRSRTAEMIEVLEWLVEAESPSSDLDALGRCADRLAEVGSDLLGWSCQVIEEDRRRHLHWQSTGPTCVALLGHYDTVFPLGTLDTRPFTVADGLIRGPGTFDMKAGLVQGLFALSSLATLDGIEVLVTADEEVGSPTSRTIIEDLGRRAAAVLVLEPSAGGRLKLARKGVATYTVAVGGRAAHAGLEPERGANALVEMARQTLALRDLARPGAGTTVTPTVAAAGTAQNVVPAHAHVAVDVRALSLAELERVDRDIRCATAWSPGTSLSITGGINRPPLEGSASAMLFERAQQVADQLGIGALLGETVGGGSDGNLTAAVGAPTLDGLGAVGAGAHADDEHVVLRDMAERAALVAGLVADLCQRPMPDRLTDRPPSTR